MLFVKTAKGEFLAKRITRVSMHEMHLQLLTRLNEMKATGMPLPEDLVELEKQLTASFDALPKADGEPA